MIYYLSFKMSFREIMRLDFAKNLIRGTILNTYKNLILDVKLKDGSVVSAFCPEIDYMNNLYIKGIDVWLSKSENTLRKLEYEVQVINKGEGLIMVNSTHIKDLFIEAFNNGVLIDFSQYNNLRKIEYGEDVEYANFEFSNKKGEKCYAYVISIYNKVGPYVVFPSFINFYEMEMFAELRSLRKKGYKTAVVLVASRMDCVEAKFVWNIDQVAAAKSFDEAKNGLNFFCYGCNIDQRSVTISKKMKILY